MKSLADILIGLSVITVIFSVVGALGFDLWLASTQWVIIAGVLGIYAIYLKIRANN